MWEPTTKSSAAVSGRPRPKKGDRRSSRPSSNAWTMRSSAAGLEPRRYRRGRHRLSRSLESRDGPDLLLRQSQCAELPARPRALGHSPASGAPAERCSRRWLWGVSPRGPAGAIENIVTAFVGTGIGGCLILDGKIFTGSTGNAGEPGHMIVKTGGSSAVVAATAASKPWPARPQSLVALQKRSARTPHDPEGKTLQEVRPAQEWGTGRSDRAQRSSCHSRSPPRRPLPGSWLEQPFNVLGPEGLHHRRWCSRRWAILMSIWFGPRHAST